jgi:hypothetical protein
MPPPKKKPAPKKRCDCDKPSPQESSDDFSPLSLEGKPEHSFAPRAPSPADTLPIDPFADPHAAVPIPPWTGPHKYGWGKRLKPQPFPPPPLPSQSEELLDKVLNLFRERPGPTWEELNPPDNGTMTAKRPVY